jgi:DNA-binding response OmpR family regulator
VLVCADSASERSEAWITGADGYLVHPFEGDALVAEVVAVVGRPHDDRDAHRQEQISLSIPDAPD